VWMTSTSMASIIAHTFESRGTAVKWEKPMTTAQLEMSATVASR